MKHLKSYVFFESSREDGLDYIEQMLNELRYLLIPIRDLGYNPYIQDEWVPIVREPDEIIIRILTYLDSKTLEITEDIIYDFDRINDYLESEGFQMSVKGVTVFNANIELSYETFINKYLNNGLSIKSFRNLLFIAKRKDKYVLENKLYDSFTYREIIGDMEDILAPIGDLGYDISAELVKDYNYYIFIKIIDYSKETLVLTEDVIIDLDRLYEFSITNGFEISKIYYKEVQPDGRIFNKGDRDVIFGYKYFKDKLKDKRLSFLSFEFMEKSR